MLGSSHSQELIAKADVVPESGTKGAVGRLSAPQPVAPSVKGGQVPAVAVAPIFDPNALSQDQR